MIEVLTQPIPDAAFRFLREWHGDPPAGAGYPDEGIPRLLPEPLRDFYRQVGRWRDAIAQNRLLAPDELVEDAGRLVFYVENQAVYLWATDRADDDAAVWGRRNEPGAQWECEGERISRFLLQVAVFEAAMGGESIASAAWLDPKSLEQVVADLVELPLAPWRWPDYPTRFFAREGVVAVVMPNRTPESSDDVSITVGAKQDAALAFLEPHITDAWEIYSPWDSEIRQIRDRRRKRQ